jgi:F420-0:gamma-glutamyl ligase
MTRSDALAIITASLPQLDDAHVATVAEIVQSLAEPAATYDLTPEDLAAVERSKEDFRLGRTYSLAQARALTDAFVAELAKTNPGP